MVSRSPQVHLPFAGHLDPDSQHALMTTPPHVIGAHLFV